MKAPTRSRIVGLGASLLLAGALAGVGTADLWVPGPGDLDPELPSFPVAPSSMTLACAPGIADPYDAGASLATGKGWTSRGSITAGVTPHLDVTADGGSGGAPSAVTLAGQGGGELRGLALLPCTSPTSDQWVATGSTEVGEDLLLVLSNPSAVPSRVSIESFGASGRSPDAPQSVTVPAGQVVVMVPATWFPDETRPAFHVTADGPGVSAWIQSSGLDGEVPTGVGTAPATDAGTELVLPGVSAGSSASVRLLAPGDDPATVTVAVSDDRGVNPLAGAEDLELDPGVTLDVDLSGVPADPVSLVVTSDVPVVATADVRGSGEQWPDSRQHWGTRTLVVPSTATTGVDLPAVQDLSAPLDQLLGAAVLRRTSVETPAGSGDLTAELVVTAPRDGPVTVTSGGTDTEVPAGGSTTLDLSDTSGALSADRPVHVALVATVGTPTGDLQAVWPLGTTGVDPLDVTVDLRP